MAKFCGRCGKQLEDNAAFCDGCGASLEAPKSAGETVENVLTTVKEKATGFVDMVSEKTKLDKKKLFLFSGIGLSVIALIIILLVVLTGPKATVRSFMNGIKNDDAEKVVDCMPKFLWDDDEDEKEDKIDSVQRTLNYLDIKNCDKFKYEIKSVDKLTKREKSDFQDLLELYEDYSTSNFKAKHVTDFREVKVKVTYTYDGDKDTMIINLILVKYKGAWKVYSYTYN